MHPATRHLFDSGENPDSSDHSKPFWTTSEGMRSAFEKIPTRLTFPAKTIVFVEGQRPTGVFIVRSGRIKLSVSSIDGQRLILRIAEEGDILGLQANFLSTRHPVSAEAMTPSTLDFVSWPHFYGFVRTHNDALLALIQSSIRECVEAYALVQTIGLPVSERLGRFLLAVSAHVNSGHQKKSVRLRLTHDEIAQLMGTSRETVTRQLSDFKKKELVECDGPRLTILKPAELESMCRWQGSCRKEGSNRCSTDPIQQA